MDLRDFIGKRICVAISGGGDSVALLHYLNAERARCGYLLCAVHCEHGIRGEESLEDMRFTKELCAAWNIPLFLFSADCPTLAKEEKISLETAARKFRQTCFASLLAEGKAHFIATAHHQKDEAETLLFRMARGSSLTGMAGMQEREGKYLRPLLGWSKEEIEGYLRAHTLSYRTDATNLQTEATRNKIRLEVLPKLEEAVPGAVANVARFATLAAEDDGLLYRLSEKLLIKTEAGIFVKYSEEKPLHTRACLTAMKALGVEKDYTQAHLTALFCLQRSEKGAWLTLPKGLRAKRTEEGILFFLPKEEILPPLSEEQPFTEKGFDGGMYAVNVSFSPPIEENDEWKILRLDEEKLPPTAVFRFRREGDEMECFGGTKSLKKLFNEKKIPPELRAYIPLLAEGDGGVVYAVCGVEISRRVKVDETTRRVVYIRLQKKENGQWKSTKT